ncbi:MAG: ParB/RepB/Spo0J family partition protein [Candidatus Omnitrophica bacterium]|nr:ParB/RepB/Spo0J family partition protein [Candidatus Omnitrophota bacterium]
MKKVLGKGLSALIPDTYAEKIKLSKSAIQSPVSEIGETQTVVSGNAVQMVPIAKIQPNHDQPRHQVNPEGIEDLAASIKAKGVLQPVIVKKSGDDRYEIICGERRLRAALLCGLTEIPALVKDIADDEFLELALIENIQREDLTAIEEARAFQRLIEERMLSQEEIARRVGKSRVAITNTIRLLRLPSEVISLIDSGTLSAGHARALLGLPAPEHQRQLARRIVHENLSVRQVEAIVNRSNAHRRRAKSARHLIPEIVDLEHRLAEHLGTQVKIYPRKNMKEGRLEIHYYSLDDLDRILAKISLPRL